MVYVDLEHSSGPHSDTSHHKSYQISIVLHVNAWVSHECIPGDNESGPWMKGVPGNTIRHEEENAIGRFGEIECAFNTSGCKFSFEKNFTNVKKWAPNIVLKIP